MDSYCVYKHTNIENGKVYIGCTKMKLYDRWKNGKGYTSKTFAAAIKKHGWDKFTHELLFTDLTKENAFQKEVEMIAFYKSNNPDFGYNGSIGGEKSSLGYKHTDEAKKKISEAVSKARKGIKFSDEHRQHLKENHADFHGTKSPHSKFTQEQIDEIRRIHIPYNKEFGTKAIARKYGVSKGTIQCIVNNKTYKDNY